MQHSLLSIFHHCDTDEFHRGGSIVVSSLFLVGMEVPQQSLQSRIDGAGEGYLVVYRMHADRNPER